MTPVKTALISLIINVVVSVMLMWRLKIGALALATSVSAAFNFFSLYILLTKKLGDFGTRQILDSFLRCLAASVIMTAALKALLVLSGRVGAVGLVCLIFAGAAVFTVSAYLLRSPELRSFIAWISKKR
jgi:putative peptidoglycan lipid II flippase